MSYGEHFSSVSQPAKKSSSISVGARVFADSTEINVDISTTCDIRELAICIKNLSLILPGELYYKRIFQMLSNVPNIYFDNSIRWLPGFNGSNLRHTPKAQTIMAGGKYEEEMNKISFKSS